MQAAGISKAGCSRHFPYGVKAGVSLNSREVQFDMVFRRVKVVFCIGSLLQQATVTVRSTLKRTFLEPSVAESLGERLWRNFAGGGR